MSHSGLAAESVVELVTILEAKEQLAVASAGDDHRADSVGAFQGLQLIMWLSC